MAEYIEKEVLLKRLDMAIDCKNCPRCVDMKTYYDRCAYTDIQDVCGVISDMPATDVQPVKHGYWIKQPEKFQIHEDVINSNYLYSCSCCNASDLHSERANNDGEVKFCWRCGAKMDLPEPIKG